MATRTQTLPDDLARVQRRQSAEAHLLYKLKAIRALHTVAYGNVNLPVDKVQTEFFYAVGDIFEGLRVEDLKLNLISKEETVREMEDGG